MGQRSGIPTSLYSSGRGMARTSKDAKCATFSTLRTAPEATNPRSWERRMDMTRIGVSRRKALKAGACALATAAGLLVTARARAEAGSSTATEEIIRKWYKAWVEKDEGQFEALMTDNFTFTS